MKRHAYGTAFAAALLLLFSNACGQTLDRTFVLADSLCAAGNYTTALPLLKRVLFFDLDQRYTSDASAGAALCLEKTGHLKEAARYYETARFHEKDTLKKNQIIFQKFTCEYKTGNYLQALMDLLSLPASMPDSLKRKKDLFLGATYLRMNETVDAEACLLPLTDTTDPENREALKSLFRKYSRVHSSGISHTFYLSLILPGAGQFCSGDVRNGMNSMMLNGAFVYLFIRTATHLTVFDAFLSVFPWFQRYYLGGAYKALQIAADRKEKRKEEIHNRILQLTEAHLKK